MSHSHQSHLDGDIMRAELINKTIRGICDETIDHFLALVAHRHCWTLERILQMRNDSIYNHVRYSRLPNWAKERITGYWEAVYKRHDRKLVWTHVIRGHRLPYNDPSITETPREISEAETYSDFAYLAKINGRLVAIPFREESRLRDINSGILTQNDIDTIISPGKNSVELLVPNHERDIIVKMVA